MALYEAITRWIKVVPDHLKMQEMCNKAVRIEPRSLVHVPDHFKHKRCATRQCPCIHTYWGMSLITWMQEMCNKAVHIKSLLLAHVPGSFKTQEMCIKVVEAGPLSLVNVFDHLKTREMCDAAVNDDAFSLVCVPNWFVAQQHLKLWDDYGDYCDDDEII